MSFEGEHTGARASGHGYVSARFARLEILVFTYMQQDTHAAGHGNDYRLTDIHMSDM